MKRIFLLSALLALSSPTFANLRVTQITPENQQKMDLKFTLQIEEVEKDVYLVKLRAPMKEGSKWLFSAELYTQDGKKAVSTTPLKRETAEEGVYLVQFKLSKDVISKSTIGCRYGTGLSEHRYLINIAQFVEAK